MIILLGEKLIMCEKIHMSCDISFTNHLFLLIHHTLFHFLNFFS